MVVTAGHAGGGHVGHVGVGSGSEAPARCPNGVEIQHRFGVHSDASNQPPPETEGVLNLDIVSPPQTREGRRCGVV